MNTLREKVEACRQKVNELTQEEMDLYHTMLEETGLEDTGWLFDYVFNYQIEDIYLEDLRKRIFGDG